MKRTNLVGRSLATFRYALNGISALLRTEKNARIHIIFAFLALVAGVILHISRVELLMVFFSIILVIFAEAINTALERTVDLIETDSSQMVKLIKDISAGAVLITAFGAVVLGVLVFGSRILHILGWIQ